MKMKIFSQFPYGEIITPERDVIGNYLEETGRTQMCIDQDLRDRLMQYENSIHLSSWKRGPWVCSKYPKRDITRVSRTLHGWRAMHRFPIPGALRTWYTRRYPLGYAFTDLPVLFPCAVSAMIAAEIFSAGQHWEVGPLAWIHPAGVWRLVEPLCS
jgi:hypothetical protein